MTTVIRAQKGRTVPVQWVVREIRRDSRDGRRSRINGALVDIEGPTGSAIITNGGIIEDTAGVFTYHFNTAGLAAGDYLVKPRFGAAFSSALPGSQNVFAHNVIVRLVETL